LSGDAFADLADLVVDSKLLNNRTRLYQRIEESSVIFCPSDLIEHLLDLTKHCNEVTILIIGNGDKNFYELSHLLKKFAKYLFIQNSFISDDRKVFTLPIGLENKRLGVNGMIKFAASKVKTLETSILVGPFSLTAKLRNGLSKEFFLGYDQFDVREQRLNLADYSKALHSHKYVLCPEGNGMDTHRLWETLYAGSIPIVSRNSWSDSLIDAGFPLVQTDVWTPQDILKEISISEFENYDARNLQQLWIPFWEKKFSKLL